MKPFDARRMQLAVLPTLTALALALGGCSSEAGTEADATPMLSGKTFVDEKGELSPELRSLVRRGKDYQPIAGDPQMLFDNLERSMSERRATAWRVVEQMIAPQRFEVDGTTFQIPLWHTWFEGSDGNPEFYGKIDLFYAKLKACKQAAPDGKCTKTYAQLAEETMNDTAGGTGAKNLASSLTNENMEQTLAQLANLEGSREHVGTGFTVFSPSFVEHVLAESKGVMNCETDHARQFGPMTPPPSAEQFSPCMTEFPRSSVMVKAVWASESQPNAAFDTSASAMATLFGKPRWGDGREEPFDTSKMYSVETREGTKYGLRSIHFSTKDTREWLWITLWWDPQPDSDFGQDRPSTIGGVWANYKMCVTSSFNERDPQPWKSFETSAPQLAGSLRANYDALSAANAAAGGDPQHLTTWCSNPNVEAHDQNNKTNCIGCHQYAASWNAATGGLTAFDDTFQPNDPNFPQQGRDRFRRTFLSDFAWGVALYERVPDRIRAARRKYGIAANE